MYTITFHIDYVEVQLSGSLSMDLLFMFARELLNSPDFSQGIPVLVDYTQTFGFSFDNFKYSDIERFAGMISRYKENLKGSKLATLLSGDTEGKAVVSLFESILEYHGQKLKHRTFTDRVDALAWLQA